MTLGIQTPMMPENQDARECKYAHVWFDYESNKTSENV